VATTTNEPTWAVVFVHGVGDTGPGKTLEAILPTLLRTNPDLTEIAQPETLLLPELTPGLPPKKPVPSPAPQATSAIPLTKRFPAHMRRFAVHNPGPGKPTHATFAEVFWADLSTAGEGTLRFLLRLFTVIFDLRFIPYVAARCESVYTARWLRLVLYAISSLLCGPIAGLTAFIAYLLAAHYGVSQLPGWLRTYVDYGPFGLALVGLTLAVGLLVWGYQLKWRRHWLWVIKWIVACALGDVVVARIATRGFSEDLEVLLRVLGGLFLAVGVLTIVAFLTWLLARGESGRRKLVHLRPALDAALAANLLQVGLWLIVVPILGIVMLNTWAPEIVSGRDPLFDDVFLSFTQNLALTVLVAGCAGLVWVSRRQWVAHHRPPYAAATAQRIPRLLVNYWIVVTIVAVSLAGTFASWWALMTGTARFGGALNSYSGGVATLILMIVAVIGGFLRKGLNNGLHILMDIVSHFSRENLPVPSLKETPRPAPDVFTIQQQLEARFRAVLEHLLDSQKVTHLTVVAHSQGTMIALDVLWLEWTANRLRGVDVDLVTMGSPFSHLYQYYFPDRYPPLFEGTNLNPDWGAHLTSTVRRWVNIYRVDDFVGTHVDGTETFPINICIPAGGHTGYWCQIEALEAMGACLPGAARDHSDVATV
jgi:hypothetical protein